MRLGFVGHVDDDRKQRVGDARQRRDDRVAGHLPRQPEDGPHAEHGERDDVKPCDDVEAGERFGVIEVERQIGPEIDQMQPRADLEQNPDRVDPQPTVLVEARIAVARRDRAKRAEGDHLIGLIAVEAITDEDLGAPASVSLMTTGRSLTGFTSTSAPRLTVEAESFSIPAICEPDHTGRCPNRNGSTFRDGSPQLMPIRNTPAASNMGGTRISFSWRAVTGGECTRAVGRFRFSRYPRQSAQGPFLHDAQ